jgi:sugar lactone lactonase YvrE
MVSFRHRVESDSMIEVTCVDDAHALLGEGPLWDPDREVVWWLDIKGSTLHVHDPATGRNLQQRLSHRLTALGIDDGKRHNACGDSGFEFLCVAPDLRVTPAEVLGRPEEPPGNRFNDGKVDAHGVFWAGSMDDAEKSASGVLYRLRGRDLGIVRTGIEVPNGPCFLADGTVLTTDSAARIITALEVNARGEPIRERPFARFTAAEGHPVGMTVVAEDHVWIAFWDGGCLRRLDASGRTVHQVPLPVRRPTCPVFGGPQLECLYVTSARVGLDEAALAHEPHAGGLLALDVGVRGRPSHRFIGP